MSSEALIRRCKAKRERIAGVVKSVCGLGDNEVFFGDDKSQAIAVRVFDPSGRALEFRFPTSVAEFERPTHRD
jgi:hypothetical protein